MALQVPLLALSVDPSTCASICKARAGAPDSRRAYITVGSSLWRVRLKARATIGVVGMVEKFSVGDFGLVLSYRGWNTK